ncbi:MAG: UDP-2,3-diacylglucosamine diphosphatase [Flavobacteriia bacterium]|jgi:UDP-2,3-diacylglucosamine hydrolase
MEETLSNQVNQRTKIYFASDFHLGAPTYEKSLEREKKICAWMEEIRPTCKELFLVGDIFDFWFEYKHAIPKGFIRLQAKILSFVESGIPVHFFTGNHDMWMFDYFPKELGVQMHRQPIAKEFFGKSVFIGHGDGLGPGDLKYKFLKKFFASKTCQWLFARIHPNFGIGLANWSSRSSRKSTGSADEIFLGEDQEWLVQFCREKIKSKHYDLFIFGHRHLPLDIAISENSRYHNLGDWLKYFTYGELSENGFELKKWG